MGLYFVLGTGELIATKTGSKFFFKTFSEKPLEKLPLKKEVHGISPSVEKSFKDVDLDLTKATTF